MIEIIIEIIIEYMFVFMSCSCIVCFLSLF